MRYFLFLKFRFFLTFLPRTFFGPMGILLFAFVAGCSPEIIREGEAPSSPLVVTVLDVGQGLAVLLECGGRHALYDSGPDSAGVADTLRARGIDSLEWVLVSHYHRDHGGGFFEFGSKVHVRNLFVGPDTSGGFVRDSVLAIARRASIPVDTLMRGVSFALCGDMPESAPAPRFDVLWPPAYVREGGNPASVVVRVEYGAGTALLTGDLDSAGERRLLELSPTLSADLLQVAHHGSAGSSSLPFLARVSPQYAVASVGEKKRYGHPSALVVRKFEYVLGDSARFFRTDRDGSVRFELWPGLGVVAGGD